MKQLFLLLILWFAAPFARAHDGENFVAADLFGSLQAGEKGAILMVHFGTTYDETRALTIDAINQKMQEAFPGIAVREAYTSRIIMRRLKARGIEKSNPQEMLDRLAKEGYTHILIQSTNIIEGIEMEELRKEAAAYAGQFKEVRVSTPLLYAPEDYEAVIDALAKKGASKGATLFVGHGTYTPATAQYAMLDYMLKAKGLKNYHVGTIEGYPTFDTATSLIAQSGEKEVLLLPFMFVAGDHANNDIAVDWKEALEKQGYEVKVRVEGLGQNPEIQQIFIDHARFHAHHKMVDISAKKRQLATEKD